MEGLDSILSNQEIDDLFSDYENMNEESDNQQETQKEKTEDPDDNNDKHDETTEVSDSQELFGDWGDKPESVGSGKQEKEQEDTSAENGSGSSPNLYSSIADACAVDGVFPNLDEEVIKKVDSAESFSDLIEAEVIARLDDKQKRIISALENGVEASDIRKYENTLNYLGSLTDAQLSEESEKAEQLRRQLIYQDYINKGYSPERAGKLTERTIDAGTDIEDAKEALQSNKDFFQKQYNELQENAKKDAEKEKAERQKESEKLKDSIMKDKTLLGDMEISGDLRKKVFESISKPVYRDPETGEYLTALQKYELEHHSDFLKFAGLFFTLTNGFKDFESFTNGKVKKEVKKGLRELEQKLSNTRRSSDGSLRMVTTSKDDPESFLGGNFRLAL